MQKLLLVMVAGSLVALASSQVVTMPGQFAPPIAAEQWWNVGKTPPKLGGGKVTIVHFWTFGCINCQRNQPIYAAWMKKYAGTDVQMIGIHTPELAKERDPKQVAAYLRERSITYPVAFDLEMKLWREWNNRFWPAVYLVDKKGRVRFGWEGELLFRGAKGDRELEQRIEALRRER